MFPKSTCPRGLHVHERREGSTLALWSREEGRRELCSAQQCQGSGQLSESAGVSWRGSESNLLGMRGGSRTGVEVRRAMEPWNQRFTARSGRFAALSRGKVGSDSWNRTPIRSWIADLAGFLLSMFEVGQDGKTASERLASKSAKLQGMVLADRNLWKRRCARGGSERSFEFGRMARAWAPTRPPKKSIVGERERDKCGNVTCEISQEQIGDGAMESRLSGHDHPRTLEKEMTMPRWAVGV